jgi:hypothetical protein
MGADIDAIENTFDFKSMVNSEFSKSAQTGNFFRMPASKSEIRDYRFLLSASDFVIQPPPRDLYRFT